MLQCASIPMNSANVYDRGRKNKMAEAEYRGLGLLQKCSKQDAEKVKKVVVNRVTNHYCGICFG